MEWFDLVSSYEPSNPNALTTYDSIRMFFDQYRAYVIFVYLIAVYYLGFATRIRMPLLKNVVLYVLLFIGAIIFSFLDTTLPVKSAMFVAVLLLVIVKVRVKPDRQRRRGQG